MQTTDTVLMVRPVNFGFNPETAANNLFQKEGHEKNAQYNALREFDTFVELLRANGVNVIVTDDSAEPSTPDSIFPNNWFSTHRDGTLVLYPMFAQNRRLERKAGVIELIKKSFNYNKTFDLTGYEFEELFLEGTGSMILDRENNIAYVCRSVRSNEDVLNKFCDGLDFTYLYFNAVDANGHEIYHTNVMMSVGSQYAIVCLDAIPDLDERVLLIETLENSGKHIVEISMEQMEHFAGNMLELRNSAGENILVMSLTAYNSLEEDQLSTLKNHFKLVTPDLTTIEVNGGGSARCMMAEIFY